MILSKKITLFGNRGASVRLCILFSALFFISCESLISSIEFEVEDAIVVNSLITPDSLFSCHLSKLADPIVDVFDVVENAKVFVFNDATNDTIAQLLYQKNGWYKAEKAKPETEIEYRLEVIVEGYDKIIAQTSVPCKGKAKNISLNEYGAWDRLTPGEKISELDFTIIDSANVRNYYDIHFAGCFFRILLYENNIFVKTLSPYEPYSPKSGESIVISSDSLKTRYAICNTYDCLSEVILNEGLSYKGSYSYSLFFSDEFFDGNEIRIESDAHIFNRKMGLFVLKTYSKELYDYQKSLIQQEWEEGEKNANLYQGKFNFSNEQVEVVSNITNGYGIFAGYNVRTYMVVDTNTNYWWEKYMPEY